MADKSFGVKELNLIGASGTPTITSPNSVNINATNVAISTDITVGGMVSLGAGTSISSPGTNVLTFGTNSTEKVRITSGGNIGIGTDNPTEKLEVLGSTLLKGTSSTATALNIRGAGTQGDDATISFTNGYTQTFKIGMSDDIGPARDFIISETSTGSSSDNENPKYIFNGNGDGIFQITDRAGGDVNVQLATSGISYLTGGNVGINDTAPSERLNVGGNIMLEGSDQYLYLTNVGTGNAGIYVRGRDATSELRSHSTGMFTWEVTGSEKMRLNSDGDLLLSGLTSKNDSRNAKGITLKSSAGISFQNFGSNGSRNWRIRPDDLSNWGSLEFSVSPTDNDNTDWPDAAGDVVLELKKDKDVVVKNGNLVIGTSGQGISFAATADGSGTMTSELLDDYEEGTWTPALQNAGSPSVSSAVGIYTKIGNFVHCTFYMAFTGATLSSSSRISGLPFAYSSSVEPSAFLSRVGQAHDSLLSAGNRTAKSIGHTSSGSTWIYVDIITSGTSVNPRGEFVIRAA